MGITKSITETETFTSPNNTQFAKVEPLRKGSYFSSTSNSLTWSADFTVTYGQLLGGKHMVNVAVGANIRENDMKTKSFSAQGFLKAILQDPVLPIAIRKEGSQAMRRIKIAMPIST